MVSMAWIKEFPGAVTVCDGEGIILAMNDQAVAMFKKQGGETLLGSNVLECHPEPARSTLEMLMDKQQRHVYTIEKKGVKKLVFQTPWYVDGQYSGFVEMVLPLPSTMPHFIRD